MRALMGPFPNLLQMEKENMVQGEGSWDFLPLEVKCVKYDANL